MSKQIQVSDDLYKRLKSDATANFRTMGAQIEFLMANRGGQKIPATQTLEMPITDVPYSKPGGTPPNSDVADLIKNSEPTAQDTFMKGEDLQKAMEQMCCKNPNQPCKHWVWDTASGEGYRNILSGRYREAE